MLCAGDKLDQLAEHFSIGAMNVDAALRFFRRVPNKAVITGGDRADIQLAALQTSTRCLILTGDLYPNERILTRAEEMGVPVVLVSQDTSTVAANLRAAPRAPQPAERAEDRPRHRVDGRLHELGPAPQAARDQVAGNDNSAKCST